MTESEWLTCADPREMLDQLRDRASARKLRWFACACVRQVWSLLLDERSQQAVAVSERFADGQASVAELGNAEMEAFAVARIADLRTTVSDPAWAATRAAARAASLDAQGAASGAAFIAALCAAPWEFDPSGAVVHHGDALLKKQARQEQCELLREIVGNPYRSVHLEPGWLAWNQGTVNRLAQEIYDGKRFEEMPVLGDALEEAGCDDTEMLRHCREPRGHVRGCWVVDVILSRDR